jgi:hypothetical protein
MELVIARENICAVVSPESFKSYIETILFYGLKLREMEICGS